MLTSILIIALCMGNGDPVSGEFGAVEPQKSSCAETPYRQFDFWAGDWDAYDSDNPTKVVARVRVERILEGCVLLENYEGANGSIGRSFSIYDASRNVWHQTWVTNHGQLLLIEGRFQLGEMVLRGSDPSAGPQSQVRGTWMPMDGGAGVREVGVTSSDGGKTWKPWFDLLFRPHKQ
jgi:hypothetical protein